MHSLDYTIAGGKGDESVTLHAMGDGDWIFDQTDHTGSEHRVVLSEAQLSAAWSLHTSHYGLEATKSTDRQGPIAA